MHLAQCGGPGRLKSGVIEDIGSVRVRGQNKGGD